MYVLAGFYIHRFQWQFWQFDAKLLVSGHIDIGGVSLNWGIWTWVCSLGQTCTNSPKSLGSETNLLFLSSIFKTLVNCPMILGTLLNFLLFSFSNFGCDFKDLSKIVSAISKRCHTWNKRHYQKLVTPLIFPKIFPWHKIYPIFSSSKIWKYDKF